MGHCARTLLFSSTNGSFLLPLSQGEGWILLDILIIAGHRFGDDRAEVFTTGAPQPRKGYHVSPRHSKNVSIAEIQPILQGDNASSGENPFEVHMNCMPLN